MFYIDENNLIMPFIDTNIDMYVPFGESVDDVTFWLIFVRCWNKNNEA